LISAKPRPLVGGKRHSHCPKVTNQGEPLKVRMTKQAQQQPLRKFTPSKKNHAPYIKLIEKAFGPDHLGRGKTRAITDQIVDWIIYTSFLTLPVEEWTEKFERALKSALRIKHKPELADLTIALGLLTPAVEKAVLEILPHIDQQKYFGHDAQQEPSKQPEPTYSPTLKPFIPKKRKPSIAEYIETKAPSINYLKVWRLLSNHTRNRFSSRGRHVFPYGQDYVSRELNLGLRSIERIFSWLKRTHLIFKRKTESKSSRKTSHWFIPTSFKQIRFFQDPKHLRFKKKPFCRRKTSRS
jgi:hypothetical protein